VIRQPDGRLAVFSDGTDRWIRWDNTPEEIVEWYAQRAAEDARRSARETVDAVLAGTAIYDPRFVMSFEEANAESGASGGKVLPGVGVPDASADVLDVPVGLYCPECGKPPQATMGAETAFCGTAGCRILKWDPTLTRAEIDAAGVHEISLGPEFR
jgi:hypothetical protein